MIILSIDLGKVMAYSINSNNKLEEMDEYKFTNYLEFYEKFKELVDLWKIDLILIPYPTRFYRIIMSHSKLMGIIELIAEKRQIMCLEVQDKTCKKVVIGKGNATKEEIAEYYKKKGIEGTEHELDSILFTDWYLKSIKT